MGAPKVFDSNDPKVPAVQGNQTGDGGTAILGIGQANGVIGKSVGKGFSGVFGDSGSGPGVSGNSTSSVGVDATTTSGPAALRAIHAGDGPGVFGACHGKGSSGVFGESKTGPGVTGSSTDSVGVDAKTTNGQAALRAINTGTAGAGVLGIGPNNGVLGQSTGSGFAGVFGESKTGPGVSGSSTSSVGVDAKTTSGPAALRAVHAGGGLAGDFGGNVHVTQDLFVDGELHVAKHMHCPTGNIFMGTGDINFANADCAEDFDVSGADKVDPGTVMVLGSEGFLSQSEQAYDKRVAGVISGAGDYKPGIVLDKRQLPGNGNRQPVALMGKVFCKVDAQFGAIEVGDLLTTSPTPGHAMKTSDPLKAFGAVIGKALRPLAEGQELIPILIALQ